jgi:hypothetical protein
MVADWHRRNSYCAVHNRVALSLQSGCWWRRSRHYEHLQPGHGRFSRHSLVWCLYKCMAVHTRRSAIRDAQSFLRLMPKRVTRIVRRTASGSQRLARFVRRAFETFRGCGFDCRADAGRTAGTADFISC